VAHRRGIHDLESKLAEDHAANGATRCSNRVRTICLQHRPIIGHQPPVLRAGLPGTSSPLESCRLTAFTSPLPWCFQSESYLR
jgi:hypothetical protein